MNLGLSFFTASRTKPMPGSDSTEPNDYVVARWVKAAPCAWIFFDGSETVRRERTGPVLVPGGAFFLDEAHPYSDPEHARAQARRLNALAADADESWVAIAARRVITGLKGFTPLVEGNAQSHS